MKYKNCIRIAFIIGCNILSLLCNAETEQQRYLNLLASAQNEEKRKIPCGRFHNDDGIEEITIPTGITSIGDRAFEDCINLQKITISGSVIFIGNIAFLGCMKLPNIIIPKSVESIGDGAFSECINLTSVEILNPGISMGANVFFGCEKLNKITLPVEIANKFLDELDHYGLPGTWEICEEKEGMVVLKPLAKVAVH